MKNIEPTYLRFVHDSLSQGTLNAENSASLPHGFIGLYEQEFSQNIPLHQRQSLLQLLAIWALFKGPVSAKMAADIVKTEEERMKKLINSFSSWFNSPETGKYQLYHERLRVYLLQKLSDRELENLNNAIVNISMISSDDLYEEINIYKFQFIGYHLLIEASINKSFDNFINTCLNPNFITDQIVISKAFIWSKKLMTEAIKLASYYQREDVIFDISKSLVLLNEKEKESLGQIFTLINESEDELLLSMLNSILDGTKENFATSYVLHIISLTYIFKFNNKEKIEERIPLFTNNIKNNFPEEKSVVNHSHLIPESITINLLVNLHRIGIDSNFIIEKCTIFNFSTKNLISFNLNELQFFHQCIKKHLPDEQLDFLSIVVAPSFSTKIREFFTKEIDLVVQQMLTNVSESFRWIDISSKLPEIYIQHTNDRGLINDLCEHYLALKLNTLPLSEYQSKFKFDSDSDLISLLPFPNAKSLSIIFSFSDLKKIVNKLSEFYQEGDETKNEINELIKTSLKEIINCLVNFFNVNFSELDNVLEKTEYKNEIHFYSRLFRNNLMSVKNKQWCQNLLKILISDKSNSDEKLNEKTDFIQLRCNLLINEYCKENIEEDEFINEIVYSTQEIEENEKSTGYNWSVIQIIEKIWYSKVKSRVIFKILEQIKNPNNINYLVKFFSHHFFKNSDFEHFNKLSTILSGFHLPSFYHPLSFELSIEQISFLLTNMELFSFDNDQDKFENYKLCVNLLSKKEVSPELEIKLVSLIKKQIDSFSDFGYKYLAIKCYAEEQSLNVFELFDLFYNDGFKALKFDSDEINLFNLAYKLPPYENFKLRRNKKKVALHVIKTNEVEYFLSNKIAVDNLFSEEELIDYCKSLINDSNKAIFMNLIDTFKDTFNQLAYKNELVYFLSNNSIDSSQIKFNNENDRKSISIAIKAIESLSQNNAIVELNKCIKEIELIEDDIDLETGEFIDGSEEKVKSLYFIINSLWKLGEKKLAREQFEIARKNYDQMEFELEKKNWKNKLDYLALLILGKKQMVSYMKDNLIQNNTFSRTMIDHVFKNNLKEMINWLFSKQKIQRVFMKSMVNSYLSYNTIEDAFLFSKSIQNESHTKSWLAALNEKIQDISMISGNRIDFKNFNIIYQSSENIKNLNVILRYGLYIDVKNGLTSDVMLNKYSNYINNEELNLINKIIFNA